MSTRINHNLLSLTAQRALWSTQLDLDRSALNDIAKHGQAAKNWFEVIVYDSKKAAKDLGFTHEELKSLKELMQKGQKVRKKRRNI